MKRYRSPKTIEMVEAYLEVKAIGLRNVRLGNCGVFATSKEDHQLLKERVGVRNY
jgi:hypothetical protein